MINLQGLWAGNQRRRERHISQWGEVGLCQWLQLHQLQRRLMVLTPIFKMAHLTAFSP